MKTYTEEQANEMVQEAVAKVERSFGGTLQNLNEENEKLRDKIKDTPEALAVLTARTFTGLIMDMSLKGTVSIERYGGSNDCSLRVSLISNTIDAFQFLTNFSTIIMPSVTEFEENKDNEAEVIYYLIVKEE